MLEPVHFKTSQEDPPSQNKKESHDLICSWERDDSNDESLFFQIKKMFLVRIKI